MTRSVEDRRIGEAETFEAFFRSEYKPVLGLAIALCRDRWAAEDVTQEAFAAAQQRWAQVADLDRPGAWVRRVVANRSVSRWRRGESEARALRRLHGLVQPSVEPELAAETVDVWVAVRSLPRRQAQVLALTYIEDLTTIEVGEILGCSPATVKTHLQRGRASVARRLGVEEDR